MLTTDQPQAKVAMTQVTNSSANAHARQNAPLNANAHLEHMFIALVTLLKCLRMPQYVKLAL